MSNYPTNNHSLMLNSSSKNKTFHIEYPKLLSDPSMKTKKFTSIGQMLLQTIISSKEYLKMRMENYKTTILEAETE